jgi:N-acetylmuramoyl-L-alanine amidase
MTRRPSPDSPLVGRFVTSPNHGERRGYRRPNCLILHYTGMPTGEAALKALTDPACEVSAHYLIWEDGSIDQLVAESDRAWHAGRASWKGENDLNSASIGIEIVNPGHDGGSPPFPDRQIEATIGLARDISARWMIAPERILAHSDIAPARKRDPGEAFPWAALWRSGVGHWTEPAPLTGSPLFAHEEEGPAVRATQALLAVYGYDVEITGVYDRQTRQAVAAFQRHFRPERVDGEADASTMATLKALIDGLKPNQ